MNIYKDLENKAMPPEKREEAKQDWLSFYVGRKISYIVTIPFLYTDITPNTITWISIFILIIAFIVSVFAKSIGTMVLTWALYFTWSLLDGVDGNIARYKKKYSPIGDILDTMGGYLAYSLMYFSAGIIAAHTESFLDCYIIYNKDLLIIFGALSSMCGIFPRLMLHKIKSSYGENSTKTVQSKASFGLIKKIALNISSITGVSLVMFLIGIIFNILDLYTIFYLGINFIKMIASLFIMLKKLYKMS